MSTQSVPGRARVKIPPPKERLQRVREMLARSDVWHVFRTQALHEPLAEHVLREDGFDAFAPIEMRWCRVARRTRRRLQRPFSLLPRYVFIGFAKGDRVPWHRLAELKVTHGVLGYQSPLKASDGKFVDLEPLCVSKDLVAQLHSLSEVSLEDGAQATKTNPFRSLKEGDRAQLTSGPFAGTEVFLSNIKGDKVLGVLSLFGSEHIVEIPLANLDAA